MDDKLSKGRLSLTLGDMFSLARLADDVKAEDNPTGHCIECAKPLCLGFYRCFDCCMKRKPRVGAPRTRRGGFSTIWKEAAKAKGQVS